MREAFRMHRILTTSLICNKYCKYGQEGTSMIAIAVLGRIQALIETIHASSRAGAWREGRQVFTLARTCSCFIVP
jgi:hypothetical protein